MKRFNYILLSLTLCFSSCSFLDVEPQVICSDTFYNTEKEVLYGLTGVYGVMNNEALYGNYYSLMLSNVDDLCYFNRPSTSAFVQVYRHDASSAEVYSAWTLLYKGIRNANAFMDAVTKTEFDPNGLYYNEARFLRAYYHFLLAQAWGDVPLRDKAVTSHDQVMIAASKQYDVLTWVVSEMEACLEKASDDLSIAPSRVTKSTIQGILARVYLFMAGATVEGGNKADFYTKAMNYAETIIDSKKHKLNDSYENVFINMISDTYDTEFHESMWEVDFLGDRSSADKWSNGRIGDLLGLQSSGSSNYVNFSCNYAYGQYDGSLKLWDLYWATDRTDAENELETLTDVRQKWNMCPYNYAGNTKYAPYGSGQVLGQSIVSIDKAPYVYDNVSTNESELAAPAIRNCGKFRRETIYEGVMDSKRLYTTINYPILRYSDVLLMYAEAYNELNATPSVKAYECVKEVRTRAKIATRDFSEYDKDSFRELVRNERGRELCFESLRKYDLIRWGIFVSEMNKYPEWAADERWSKNSKATYATSIGSSVQEKHIVLPIPAIELGVNKLLKQHQLW